MSVNLCQIIALYALINTVGAKPLSLSVVM